jgi:hypothetical protein
LAGWAANLTEGSRNTGLFWAACRAAELNIDATTALTDAGTMAGLEHWEAAATVASAYRTVTQRVDAMPPIRSSVRPHPGRTGLNR